MGHVGPARQESSKKAQWDLRTGLPNSHECHCPGQPLGGRHSRWAQKLQNAFKQFCWEHLGRVCFVHGIFLRGVGRSH